MDYMYDDAEPHSLKSVEYESVLEYAQEDVNLVGEIGYYYPAKVWIGRSGTIYATHDYDDEVHGFDNVVQLIEAELLGHDLNSVAMKA